MEKKSMRTLCRLFNVGYAWGYSPYSLCEIHGKVNFNPSRSRWRYWCGVLLVEVWYFVFIAGQSYRTVVREDESPTDKFQSFYLFLVTTFFILNLTTSFIHYGHHHNIINGVFHTIQLLQDELGLDKNGQDKKIASMTRGVSTLCIFGLARRFLLIWTDPTASQLLTSLAPRPESVPWVIKVLCGAFQFYLNGHLIYSFILNGFPIYYHAYYLLPVLRSMRLKKVKRLSVYGYTSMSRNYTRLRVLENNFMSVYNVWPLNLHLVACAMSTVYLFMAVIFKGLHFFIIGGGVLMYSLKVFHYLSSIYSLSSQTLSSWDNGPLWFRKFRRAIRPLRVNAGSFGFIDKSFVMTFLTIVIDKCTTLIITFKET